MLGRGGSCRSCPPGQTTFAANGNPSFLRLHFRVFNAAAAGGGDLTPASGCHCFFSQMRVLIGGTEVERVEPHSMCHKLFRVALNTPQSQVEQAANFPPMAPQAIAPQAYKSVTLTSLAGLLQCGKHLPLRLMNSMVLEFTLARTDDALAAGGARDFQLPQCELQYSTVRLD